MEAREANRYSSVRSPVLNELGKYVSNAQSLLRKVGFNVMNPEASRATRTSSGACVLFLRRTSQLSSSFWYNINNTAATTRASSIDYHCCVLQCVFIQPRYRTVLD
jgi:hypothetical protein